MEAYPSEMMKGLLAPLFRLLERNTVMPDSTAIHDLDQIINFIADQEDEALMRAAIQEIYAAIDAAEVAQPGAFFL